MSARLRLAGTLVCGLATVGLSACSGGSGGSSALPSLVSTVNEVNSKMNDAAGVIDGVSALKLSSKRLIQNKTPKFQPPLKQEVSPLALGLHTVWTTDPGVSDMYNVGNYSLKEWFQDEFNPNFVNSNGAKVTFVGRIANTLDIFCYMGAMGVDMNVADGTISTTIPSSVQSYCGASGDVVGQAVDIVVTTPVDTTYYDKSFSIDLGNGCPFRFKSRINSTSINIVTSEDQSCDGRDQASMAVIHYDKTNDKIRFEYIAQAFSGFPGGFEYYRGYYNAGADDAYILGIYGGDDGTAGAGGLQNYVAFTAVGHPEAGGDVAISAKTGDMTIADATYNGCINPATAAVTSASVTLSCAMTGEDIDTTAFAAIVSKRGASSAIADIYNIGETDAPSFADETDIFQ